MIKSNVGTGYSPGSSLPHTLHNTRTSTMARRTSQLWEHFDVEEGAIHIGRCKHCNKTFSRGKEDTARPNNSGLINHLRRLHKDAYQTYTEAEKRTKKTDVKDETVRGCIPLFNLKNHGERKQFLKQICLNKPIDASAATRKDRDMDLGILSMIILDLEPFNFVSRSV